MFEHNCTPWDCQKEVCDSGGSKCNRYCPLWEFLDQISYIQDIDFSPRRMHGSLYQCLIWKPMRKRCPRSEVTTYPWVDILLGPTGAKLGEPPGVGAILVLVVFGPQKGSTHFPSMRGIASTTNPSAMFQKIE